MECKKINRNFPELKKVLKLKIKTITIRKLKVENNNNTKCWLGCKEIGSLMHCWRECKII